MAAQFRFLEDIAVADVAFEASGDTPVELCRAAAQALCEVMVDPSTVGTSWRREIARQEETLEELLFEWLSALVYLKDAEAVLFREVEVLQVAPLADGHWSLAAVLTGEAIDPCRLALRADVKAVTKHLYGIRQEDGRYVVRVVLDV